MNALSQVNHRPLRAFAVDEARNPLLVLFAAYPEPWTDKSADRADDLSSAKVSAYLMGLDGLPGWAIEQAVKDFIQGRIDRPVRRKGSLPTVEEISVEARGHVNNEGSKQRAEAMRVEQFQERKAEYPQEHRERMGFKMSLLSMGLSRREVEKVAQANARGLESMIALGQTWGVPVPECLFGQIKQG
jgi:hypothetical protein